jgi:hypothetical protein
MHTYLRIFKALSKSPSHYLGAKDSLREGKMDSQKIASTNGCQSCDAELSASGREEWAELSARPERWGDLAWVPRIGKTPTEKGGSI